MNDRLTFLWSSSILYPTGITVDCPLNQARLNQKCWELWGVIELKGPPCKRWVDFDCLVMDPWFFGCWLESNSRPASYKVDMLPVELHCTPPNVTLALISFLSFGLLPFKKIEWSFVLELSCATQNSCTNFALKSYFAYSCFLWGREATIGDVVGPWSNDCGGWGHLFLLWRWYEGGCNRYQDWRQTTLLWNPELSCYTVAWTLWCECGSWLWAPITDPQANSKERSTLTYTKYKSRIEPREQLISFAIMLGRY